MFLLQPSDDDDEDMLVGGGEGMAESVLGADFLGLQDAGVRRLPAAAPAAKMNEAHVGVLPLLLL